ncbi:MAG: double-stranded uracil-DNA glycosylase [Actinomycetota bacterium]|nr:double-stranded uracil-DNA glycosylase [Actinomycetota bacterium]
MTSEEPAPWRPSSDQLAAAYGKRIKDVIADDLDVLFCGINPGLYSGAVGHHFARPGNRFWPALHASGFTPTLLGPFSERRLLGMGLGVTNLVARTTARADELSVEELEKGARSLKAKVAKRRPRFLAVLGLTAYRHAFGRKDAGVGEQPELLRETRVWLLPNPSGLNAHYQLPDLAREFGFLRAAVERHRGAM